MQVISSAFEKWTLVIEHFKRADLAAAKTSPLKQQFRDGRWLHAPAVSVELFQ